MSAEEIARLERMLWQSDDLCDICRRAAFVGVYQGFSVCVECRLALRKITINQVREARGLEPLA